MDDNNQSIKMIVRWNEQRREINININDNLNTIERSIISIYQLQNTNIFQKYQIQYYHHDYQKFMDLYSDSFDEFKKLLQKLVSADAPLKSTRNWVLKIVSRSIGFIRKYKYY